MFSGLNAINLKKRINDGNNYIVRTKTLHLATLTISPAKSTANAKVVITANEGVVGGQHLPLKATVDSAVKDTAVEVVLVAARTQTEVTMIPGRDLSLDKVKHVSDHHH